MIQQTTNLNNINVMEKITLYETKHNMVMSLYQEIPITWDNTGTGTSTLLR